jgi:hypothetical protein
MPNFLLFSMSVDSFSRSPRSATPNAPSLSASTPDQVRYYPALGLVLMGDIPVDTGRYSR